MDPRRVGPFLREAARYFGRRPTGGEDSAVWANVANAENCIRAADAYERLHAAAGGLIEAEDALFAQLVSEGKDPESYGFPFPLMSELRDAVALSGGPTAHGNASPSNGPTP